MEPSSPPTATMDGGYDSRQASGMAESSVLPLDMTAAFGVAPSTSSDGASGNTQHPNIFVRGLPLAWSESEITAVFNQFGNLSTIRLVRHSVTKQSLGYGFVRYQEISEAQAAISALDGTSVLGHTLQVKFADADAGPPSTGAASGLTPSDSCYVKHLPATYGVTDAQQLFEAHGAVLDVKLFPCLDQFRGASALVRMASIEAAERAIAALNNSTPPGAMQSLIVRYAESPTEKAARMTRRERQQLLQRNADVAAGLGTMDQVQLQQAMAALGLAAPNGAVMGGVSGGQLPPHMRSNGNTQGAMPMGVPQQYQAAQSSICVKGMPATADRLWMYENFARFGAIVGMRILIDEATGLCNGTGFINFADHSAAQRARQAMSGMRAADNILHVVVQQQQQGQRQNSGGNLAVASGMGPGAMGVLPLGDPNDYMQQLLQPVNGNMVW